MDKPAILLVDDEELIRTLIQSTLSDDYSISAHESGEPAIVALEKALEGDHPFCLAILDVNLPGMNGLNIARQLRKLDDRLYVLMITGGSDATIDQFEGELAANTVLFKKPFSVHELILITRYFANTWDRDRELEKRKLELQEVAAQRQKSEALNAAIVETALDCIITINHNGEIIEWNPAAEDTFGYSRDEILGKTMSETIVPEHLREAHSAGMQRYLDTRVSHILRQRIEIVALHRDGHEFPVEIAIAPLELGDDIIFTAYLRDISAQKEAEMQTRLQTQTLEAAANAIIITDTEGLIVWCNQAFLLLTGYESPEVLGHSTRMLKSGEHDKSFYKSMWDTISQGKVWQGELRNKRKDGSVYIEDMTITPVTNPDGDISNYIAIKQDATERIELNEQLVRNERNQRIISYFATSLLGSNTIEEILWDITYNCISELGWEDAVVYLFNDDRTCLVQRAAYGSDKARDYQILNPIKIPIGKGIVGSVAASGKTEIISDLNQDDRYIVDDQSRSSELAVPIIYEDQVLGVIDSEHSQLDFFQPDDAMMLEAISSLAANKLMRTLSTQQTEESERKYRNIFESIQDVYAEIVYPPGIIREISPSVEGFSGYSREELIGKPFADFVAKSGLDDEFLIRLQEEGTINDYEVTMLDKAGSHRPVSFTGSFLRDEDSNSGRVVGTMRDISVRKQAELALQESVQMKSNFVSNVSHELRTPMASILGFAGTILRDDKMPDDTRVEFTRIIYEEAQRLTRLIENVLDISRMEAGTTKFEMNVIDFGSIVTEALETQHVLATEKGVELTPKVAKELPPILGANDALNQLVVNLVSNAMKFTDPGGEVLVELSSEAEHLNFSVKDTGIGIPEAEVDKIFDKFYRVDNDKREDEGTGIGLAIVREIVEQHNGIIEVSSKIGEGTQFRVQFPIYKA